MSRSRSYELIDEVQEASAQFVKEELAIDDAKSLPERVARRLTDWLSDAWGGQSLYIPMDTPRRNARIFEAFTGANHHELAERFHMSINTVYAVLRDERQRRQPGLFDELD